MSTSRAAEKQTNHSLKENTMTIDHPLRLAVGSHQAGSGKGCAMNVISWENGDKTITDYPECADRFLAQLVQSVNDNICSHRDGDLLCPECSTAVLELGHRTVGTAGLGLTDLEMKRVYVTVAVGEARSVLHLTRSVDRGVAVAAIEAAEAWLLNPTAYDAAAANAAYAAAHATSAAYAAAYAAANAAAYAAYAAAAYAAYAAAAYAAYAAAHATAYAAANAAANAAYAAANAAYAGKDRLARAHKIINMFDQLTGHIPASVDEVRTATAIEAMLAGSGVR